MRRLPDGGGAWTLEPVAPLGVIRDCNMRALPQLQAAFGEDHADLCLYDTGARVNRAPAEAHGRPGVHPRGLR